jgi:hypothetical protein
MVIVTGARWAVRCDALFPAAPHACWVAAAVGRPQFNFRSLNRAVLRSLKSALKRTLGTQVGPRPRPNVPLTASSSMPGFRSRPDHVLDSSFNTWQSCGPAIKARATIRIIVFLFAKARPIDGVSFIGDSSIDASACLSFGTIGTRP